MRLAKRRHAGCRPIASGAGPCTLWAGFPREQDQRRGSVWRPRTWRILASSWRGTGAGRFRRMG